MYDLWAHRSMCLDRVRIAAYARAIAEVVTTDDVVLDLGCGIGAMTVFAARAGARRVFAIDLDDSVHYARRVVEANGVGSRVTFFRGRIEDVDLPEPPTVIVGDLHGALPFGLGAASAWNAARRRAAPGVRTIPRLDVVMAQPIRSESLRARVHGLGEVEGVRFDVLRDSLANGAERIPDDAVAVADASPLFAVRYDRPLVEACTGRADFALPAGAVVDGFRIGFESELSPGVKLRSFGDGAATAYGVLALPARNRIVVERAATIGIRVATREVANEVEILWAIDVAGVEGPWQSRLIEGDQSLDVVRAGFPDHVPAPDRRDAIDAALLARFCGGASLAQAVAAARADVSSDVSDDELMQRAVEISRRRQARSVRRYEGK